MISPVRHLRANVLVALLLLAGMLALSHPAGAAGLAQTERARAGVSGVSAGRDLLVNPRGTAGAASAQGWDAVTIPGWQVSAGLPTVVPYGTPGFPQATGAWPAGRGRIFAGGAGGTGRLTQSLSLRQPSGEAPPAGTRYRLSAWLGGTATSWSEVTVRFLSASGGLLASRTIGPVGRSRRAVLAARAGSGVLTGYNRAVAADLGFTVSAPAAGPAPLTTPTAQVPPYQHVFLFYFENEDFGQVIGNTRQAPYLNSLLPQGSLLAQFYAEEHPSDGNYLALAVGSAFGVPLDDPEEENPQYTIHARNIGDLADAAHETWKAYLQSANGPCDDTVHGYYWNDDQPMMYFADVRDRPGYCAAHLTPLASLQSDLASTATTPDFAWIAPDDCADMEGCGIAAGDAFLAQELGMIMASPAWRTQRSLAIITFDEDAQDYQHPAQRVPTIILGSAGVRPGYVSSVRYTHYSLLRTIEAALGLGTLTANDRYAQPVNDVFTRDQGEPAASTAVTSTASASAPSVAAPSAAGPASGKTAGQPVAWVANYASASVTPVNLASRKAGRAIRVGADPVALAVTPDGRTAYVANSGSDTVTPIAIATATAGRPIPAGYGPDALTVTPDGTRLFVVDGNSDEITPIATAMARPGRAVAVGYSPVAVTMQSSGATAYVVSSISGTVTPLAAASGRTGSPISVGLYSYPTGVALAGSTAVVLDTYAGQVTLINIRTRHVFAPVTVAGFPAAVAISG